MRKKAAGADPPPTLSAAEQDARNMLLAAGLKPEPDVSAVAQLLQDLGAIAQVIYTVSEFCELIRISRPTYFRMQRKGLGPKLTLVAGMPRITKDSAMAWLQAQPGVEQPEPEPDAPAPRVLPPRRLRLPKPEGKSKKRKSDGPPSGVPRLFDPPPKKRGRTRRMPVAVNGDEEGDEA